MLDKIKNKIKTYLADPLALSKTIYLTIIPFIFFIFLIILIYIMILGIFFIRIGPENLNRMKIISYFILSIFALYLYFILKSKTSKIWFHLTILFILFTLISGIIFLHIIDTPNYLTNLGILFSVAFFSIPLGMEALKNLYGK